jgi:hypothetical protein
MLSKRDYIYYDYRLDNIKPKNILWKLYCIIRRKITFKESPSKITIYSFSKGSE